MPYKELTKELTKEELVLRVKLLEEIVNNIGKCAISDNVNKQKELEDLVKDKNKLLDAVLNNVDAFIYMKDEQRHFHYVNNKTAELFGKPSKDIIGKLDSDVIGQEMANHFWQSDKLVFETNQQQTIHEIAQDANGNSRHYLSTKMPYQLNENSQAMIGFSTDVTELFELKEEFRKQANTDPLTGLYNRRYFFEHAIIEFSRAKRHELNLTIISIDIDHFKKINDKYGHPIGDKVLIELGDNIISSLRQEDILARIGGEEFSIMLPNTTLEQAKVVAQRICHADNDYLVNEFSVEKIKILISVGVVSMNESDKDFDDLFIRADRALYQAKNSGRNQVYIDA
jgi:diguanylate cyclase (GGDEF)-like protein/PAS domain S-box-containing protein